MYNQNNLKVLKHAGKEVGFSNKLSHVAFYGNRTVATDGFSLVEMSAEGEAHAPVFYPATLLKAVKIPKGTTLSNNDFGLTHIERPDYPNVDAVLDEACNREDDIVIKINATYLINALSTLKDLNRFGYVTLSIPSERGRAVVVKGEGEKQWGRALVMPSKK